MSLKTMDEGTRFLILSLGGEGYGTPGASPLEIMVLSRFHNDAKLTA